jgi:predicted DCC family thiol-disulfide oxidoreductase YuxK
MSKDCPLSTEHNGPSTRHAVLFDGDCALCNGVARFVGANDPNGRFSLIPLRSPEGEALLAATGGPTTDDTFVLLDYGRRFERSDAALYLALGLRWPLPLAFALLLVPRTLRDELYAFVAAHRHVLTGGGDG